MSHALPEMQDIGSRSLASLSTKIIGNAVLGKVRSGPADSTYFTYCKRNKYYSRWSHFERVRPGDLLTASKRVIGMINKGEITYNAALHVIKHMIEV